MVSSTLVRTKSFNSYFIIPSFNCIILSVDILRSLLNKVFVWLLLLYQTAAPMSSFFFSAYFYLRNLLYLIYAKQPQCPPEKKKAIKEALRPFGMI